MSLRWVLRLYPRAWRERYGDELLALLESEPLNARTVRDVTGAAIGEWLHHGSGVLPQAFVLLRTLLGYYCATQLIWWGMSSMEFLEFQPASPQAWTPEGLLLSALIQVRAAVVCAVVVFGLGWVVLGPYPTIVRRWVLDVIPVIALIAMVISTRLLEGAGIGPSREVAQAYFGDWMTLSVCAHMWTMNWAIPAVRRWIDEPESLLPFMPRPRS